MNTPTCNSCGRILAVGESTRDGICGYCWTSKLGRTRKAKARKASAIRLLAVLIDEIGESSWALLSTKGKAAFAEAAKLTGRA